MAVNRVAVAADRTRAIVAGLDDAARAAVERSTRLEAIEHGDYQTMQARARARELLTLDEATTIYGALGPAWGEENGGWAPGTDLATKVTVLTLLLELERRGGS